MEDKGEVVRERQKLLRNLYFVDLVLDMIKSPLIGFNNRSVSGCREPHCVLEHPPSLLLLTTRSSPTAIHAKDIAKYPAVWEVINAGYDVLREYLKGDSRKNELFVARYIPFFQTQVRRVVGRHFRTWSGPL